MRCGALALVLGLGLPAATGCPEPRRAPVDEPPCERIGQRCRTPDGPLGICNEGGGECPSPPCLTCVPQH